MYNQSINNIKVVIIPLDGTVFDLNRYRYNYYHHLCEHQHIDLDKQDFYSHLSNMYDMYNDLPLNQKEDIGLLNVKIEREMYQYLSHKGLKPKEGFIELLEYLHQKNIKIAIISTHRTKDAVEYLKMTKLFNKVQFIIGSDTRSLPLPATQMLETITKHFQVHSEETLVISSFLALNQAAHQLKMNIIYCEDLVTAGHFEKETSFKITHNLFEVLNILLFDRFEEAEIFSPILGMSSDMSINELAQVKDKLAKTYQDDSQILDVINQTYAYHIHQLNEQNTKDESEIDKLPAKRSFHFDDEPELDLPEEINAAFQDEKTIDKIDGVQEEPSHIPTLNEQEEDELTTLLQQINQKKPVDSSIKTITDFDEIREIVETSQENISTETKDQDNDEEESPVILSGIVNVLYIFAISFLIVFIGLIIYVAFIFQFDAKEGMFGIMAQMFQIYYTIIESLFSVILNGLHSLLNFIPSYEQYSTANQVFSMNGIILFNIFIFNSLLICLIKVIFFILRRSHHHEVDYS